MAQYIMQEMPDVRGNGKRTKYPRMLISTQVDLRRLAKEIADGTTFGVGEVEGIICTLTEKIASYMAWGYSVRINGMGSFTPALELKPGIERETEDGKRRNATSITVGKINFRPDRSFVRQTAEGCTLERARGRQYTSPRTGQNQRLARVVQHIQTHGSISLAEYTALTGLSRTSAGRELVKLREAGALSTRGRRTHSVYVLPEREAEG